MYYSKCLMKRILSLFDTFEFYLSGLSFFFRINVLISSGTLGILIKEATKALRL